VPKVGRANAKGSAHKRLQHGVVRNEEDGAGVGVKHIVPAGPSALPELRHRHATINDKICWIRLPCCKCITKQALPLRFQHAFEAEQVNFSQAIEACDVARAVIPDNVSSVRCSFQRGFEQAVEVHAGEYALHVMRLLLATLGEKGLVAASLDPALGIEG